MKRFLYVYLFLCVGAANATIVTDFTGDYDVSNWTQALNGGVIDLSGAPSSILEISNNSGGGFSSTDFTIAAIENATITFDWLYNTNDVDGSSFDPFGFLLNGIFMQLTIGGLFTTQSGTESFDVLAGDIFGFSQIATDSVLGSGSTVISGFSAVPEPTTLALLALGLIGIGFSRKKSA